MLGAKNNPTNQNTHGNVDTVFWHEVWKTMVEMETLKENKTIMILYWGLGILKNLPFALHIGYQQCTSLMEP